MISRLPILILLILPLTSVADEVEKQAEKLPELSIKLPGISTVGEEGKEEKAKPSELIVHFPDITSIVEEVKDAKWVLTPLEALRIPLTITIRRTSEMLLLCGFCLQITGNTERAINAYNEAIDRELNNMRGYKLRGRLLLQTGGIPLSQIGVDHTISQDERKLVLATLDFQKAINLDPLDASIHICIGWSHFLLRKYESAVSELSTAIDIDRNSAEAFQIRGNAYLALERVDDAIMEFNEAILLKPNSPIYYYLRGLAYFCKKDYKEAALDFDSSINAGIDSKRAYTTNVRLSSLIAN